jgi:hypothetical protein
MNEPRTLADLATIPSDSPEQRYDAFVETVAARGLVWGLKEPADQGWVTAEAEGVTAAPFWPAAEDAARCATDAWAGCVPASSALSVFLERWLPGLEKDERVVSVFPLPSAQGVSCPAATLRAEIEDELRARAGEPDGGQEA